MKNTDHLVGKTLIGKCDGEEVSGVVTQIAGNYVRLDGNGIVRWMPLGTSYFEVIDIYDNHYFREGVSP